ncbi:MAG TPA: MFS transporter [Kofleriaceae bacterium]|jgi:MFS family permease|nr:MFS transporter [Kofleriaceae bacterium]
MLKLGPRAGLDPRVWHMAFARAVNTMGLSLVMSFLGIYIVKARGYPAWTYGLIALCANLGQSMSNAWAGNLSDRIGRRPLITNALFVRAGVVAVLGTQILLDAPLWTLGITMVISSTLRGCFEPVAYALVSDVVSDDQRVAAFGIQRMGTNVGWAVGPALGGLLSKVMPYGAVFYLAAGGMIVTGFLTLRVEDPKRQASAPAPAGSQDLLGALLEGLADPVMSMLLIGTFLCALLETQMFSTFSIYMTTQLPLTEVDVGLLYALNGVAVLVLQIPALALIRRLGIGLMLPWSSLLDAIGFAVIGLASGFTGGALAIFILTCAEVLFDPAQQAAIAEVADPARRGRTFGVVGFASMVGIALAPLLGGRLLDAIGSHHVAMWLAIAVIGAGQTACFIAFVRRRTQVRPLDAA